MTTPNSITSQLKETRTFEPPKDFSERSHFKSLEEYTDLYNHSIKNPELFWNEQSNKHIVWDKKPTKTLEWESPDARWFSDGTLNASVQCLDRHLDSNPDRTAIIWQGEPEEDVLHISYKELHEKVCQCANALEKLGLKTGDVATIYLPMVPELSISVLACARLGVIHNVVFAGFSAHALAERCRDSNSKLLITSDGAWRGGKRLDLKSIANAALDDAPSVTSCLVVQRFQDTPLPLIEPRDIAWSKIVDPMPKEFEAVSVPSEHPLFLLYTSGSTGKPKGIQHATAGYMLQTRLSFEWIFDYQKDDVYWCTADVGWITGHSYVIYGPLSAGATVLMYEGAPMCPDPSRFWNIIDKHQVSIFYTAPTAIRALMRTGDENLESSSRKSLRLLGTVGEPINPEAWMWYREKIGLGKCPIVDTWWQTETGSIMIAPLPGAVPTKPGTATLPFFGIKPEILNEAGEPVTQGEGGYLVLSQPWPSMLRGIYKNAERYAETYWSKFPGKYFTGDGARQDEDGNYWLLGRMDDVINVSGHRLSTMEIESALVAHPDVSEAATIGAPDEVKGEAIVCFVSLKASISDDSKENWQNILSQHIVQEIGALARPREIRITSALPKTRSGKIMRRLLRKVASGESDFGDVSTLENKNVLNELVAGN